MHQISLRRVSLLAAALLATLFAVPVAARADDRSFADSALVQVDKLSHSEAVTGKALRAVTSRGVSAIPAARRQIKLLRRQVDRFTAAVKGEQTSTADGAALKRDVLDLMVHEKSAYGTFDRALVAYTQGNEAATGRLLRQANGELTKLTGKAEATGERLRAMAK